MPVRGESFSMHEESVSSMDSAMDVLNEVIHLSGVPMMSYGEIASSPTDNTQESIAAKKKRQRLDHLTAEQKLMRRKLKNRAAAQNARDRKKAHMEDLETEVIILREDNTRLKAVNIRLAEMYTSSQQEKKKLEEELKIAQALLGERRDSSATSLDAVSGAATTIEHASHISGPLLKDQVEAPITTPMKYLPLSRLLLTAICVAALSVHKPLQPNGDNKQMKMTSHLKSRDNSCQSLTMLISLISCLTMATTHPCLRALCNQNLAKDRWKNAKLTVNVTQMHPLLSAA